MGRVNVEGLIKKLNVQLANAKNYDELRLIQKEVECHDFVFRPKKV